MDLSNFNNVFCDSKEALLQAYNQGLPESAIIRSSSPSVLWDKKDNIVHIEARWGVDEMQDFQESIQKFSEEIFDAVMTVEGINQEKALCVAKASVAFQRTIFKAACIEESDLTEQRLILQVNSKQCGSRNVLNPPWEDLLVSNPNAHVVSYALNNEKWDTLTTKGVPWWKRVYIAGVHTLLYRVLFRLEKYLPSILFNKQVLIPNENELSIEILSALALRRCKLTGIEKKKSIANDNNKKFLIINEAIKSVVAERMGKWITPGLTSKCEDMFFNEVDERLNLFDKLVEQWHYSIPSNNNKIKSVLLINSPVSTKWLELVNVCRKKGVPVISVQHGVTHEINPSKENDSALDINASDCYVAYNKKSADIALNSHFRPGEAFVSGISGRHMRMKDLLDSENCITPIVYISTRMYNGNMGGIATWMTDYDVAKWEYGLVKNVFNKLPYKVRYKTYPEETRRYADSDPAVDSMVKTCSNVEVFDKKVDMRFLINQHQVFVTSFATSTVSWVIASGKPVVFINIKNSGALSHDAYKSFQKGIFVFDDTEENFYENLNSFLSKPIKEIQNLWKQKEKDRNLMINDFFTLYGSGSGKRAASMIMDEYL